VPHVSEAERVEVGELGKGFWRVDVRYGFVDEPDVPRALELCRAHAPPADLMLTSFFLSRETLIPTPGQGLGPVAERLFMALAAGGLSATAYFRVPPDRVVEVGTQVEI
jgi:KUP system potassium uptake protein